MDRSVDPASLLLFPERKQPIRSRATDHVGLGGDVKFLRTTEDVRYCKSLNSDLVGMVRPSAATSPAGAASRSR